MPGLPVYLVQELNVGIIGSQYPDYIYPSIRVPDQLSKHNYTAFFII